MRTDVKVGLFLGIAALLLAGWFYWPQATNLTRTVPVVDMGRPVGVTFGTTERSGTARSTPSVEPLTAPPVSSSAAASHQPPPVVVPPAPAVPVPAPVAAVPAHPADAVVAAPGPSMMPSADTGSPAPAAASAAPAAGAAPLGVTPAPMASASAEVTGAAKIGGASPLTVVVRSGQTLEQIADEYYKDGDKSYDQVAMVKLLRQANPQIANGKRLRAGTKIRIPEPGSMPAVQAATVSSTAQTPVVPSLATVTTAQPVAAVQSPSTQGASVSAAGSREYKVQRGDTLYSIATKQLGSSRRWHEVLDLNTGTLGGKPEGLKPGQVLRLPS